MYYGQTDFRFENSTDYPIKIVTSSYDQGGKRKLNVKIYGTNVDGIRAEPKSTVYETVSPTTQYKADESITQGTTKVDSKQNPYPESRPRPIAISMTGTGICWKSRIWGRACDKMRPKTILYNPADGDPATWPNGVPPVQAPPPAETVPETPAENTGSGRRRWRIRGQRPRRSPAAGRETLPQRNSRPRIWRRPVHPRMLEAQRRRQGMFQGIFPGGGGLLWGIRFNNERGWFEGPQGVPDPGGLGPMRELGSRSTPRWRRSFRSWG